MDTSELLESLFDAIPDVIGIQDRHHGIIRYNAAGYKFLNMTHKETEGKKCYELIGRSTPCDICATTECYKTKKPTRVEKYVEEMNVWLDVRAYPILDENGEIVKVIEHLRDITENKRVEEALRESEARYWDLYENAPTAYFSVGVDGLIRRCNMRAGELFECPVEELVGKPVFELYADTPQGKEKASKVFQRFLAGERFADEELQMQKVDGTPVWISLTVNTIRDAEGQIVGSRSMVVDITERKQTEESLVLAKLVIENSPAVLFRWKAAKGWPVELASKNVAQFGYRPEELLSGEVPYASLVHPDDLERVAHEVRRRSASGVERFQQEYRIITKDGKVCWVDDRTVIERDADGQITHYQGIVIDITKRKRAEKALRKAHNELERRVEERTAELAKVNDKLRRKIEERKLVEESLRESEKRYFLATSAGKVGVWDWNLDTNEIYLDPMLKTFLGYENHEIRNHIDDWGKRVHPEDQERVMAEATKHLEGASLHYESEHRMLHKDGSIRWFLARGTAMRDKSGKPYRMLGTDTDITERKRADEALKKSEARLAEAQHTAHLGGWEWNIVKHEVHWSAELYRIFDVDPDEFKPSKAAFLEHVHPDDRPYLEECIAAILSNKEPFSVDNRIILPSGTIRYLHSKARMECDAANKPVRLVGISQDITERKQAEDALREREKRFSDIADNALEWIWETDADGKYIFAGPVVKKILGYEPEEILDKHFYDLFYPDDREELRKAMFEVGARREPFREFVNRNRHKSGKEVWLSTSAVPVFDEEGNIMGYRGADTDITDRKRSEEALRKSYTEIEQLKDRLQAESEYLRAEIKLAHSHKEIVGKSEAIKKVFLQIEQVAPTESSVLITGETGTGKELIARAIHNLSKHKNRVMVKVDCASLPSALIESELFGRQKGAYTGALTSQVGRFEVADGSTIFLDEIGELSTELQAKLLRVLQDGEFERLGSPKTIRVNVRVIAATNRDLSKEVHKGNFREDLYYRLNVFCIEVPPLRERLDDIPLLVWTFVNDFAEKMGKKIQTVPKRTMEAFQRYHWPGNVRELRNVIEHAVIISTSDILKVKLPQDPRGVTSRILTLEDTERQHITKVLERTTWRIKGQGGAAELLGLKPSTLYTKMNKLGIVTSRNKDAIPT